MFVWDNLENKYFHFMWTLCTFELTKLVRETFYGYGNRDIIGKYSLSSFLEFHENIIPSHVYYICFRI